MTRRALSLRAILSTVTVVVTLVALIVSGALVVLTTLLHRASVSIGSSVESVRLAEEAEVDLLLYERANDVLLRREIEGNIRGRLAEAGRYTIHPGEMQVLEEAIARSDEYLRGFRTPDRSPAELEALREAAYGALEELVALNVANARAAEERADRWDQFANLLGVTGGAGFLLVTGWLLLWLKHRAFQPIRELAQAMERFGKGERNVRAEESGPLELREMSRRFNEVASAIASQRQAQIAFLGGVAHDLRNPLTALKMSVATVRPGRPLPPEPRLRQSLALVDRQITRLERMIGDLIDVAKTEAGELELRIESQDARSLAREVVDLFEGASSRHRLELLTPEEEIPVLCDPLRVEQVLTNLISNSIKYSPAGGPVSVAVEQTASEVVFRVADHGVGISDEDQHRLFEPFRRLGLSRETVPGVGLGLFVVKRIVEAHRGRIEVRSTPGQGSTFEVYLPLAQGLEQPAPLH